MFQAKHYVSTKVALYSHDVKSVLIMHYPTRDIYGLPGGHVDANELPDSAIARELVEELNLTIENIKRADFFYLDRQHKKIILAYTAVASEDISIDPVQPNFEYGIWMTKDQVQELNIAAEYKRFILENWPNF